MIIIVVIVVVIVVVSSSDSSSNSNSNRSSAGLLDGMNVTYQYSRLLVAVLCKMLQFNWTTYWLTLR